MWGAYDDDFEEVGLLGRERGPHGYDNGGAARRGAAARTLGRGKEGGRVLESQGGGWAVKRCRGVVQTCSVMGGVEACVVPWPLRPQGTLPVCVRSLEPERRLFCSGSGMAVWA